VHHKKSAAAKAEGVKEVEAAWVAASYKNSRFKVLSALEASKI
jgi:hypothetical protein